MRRSAARTLLLALVLALPGATDARAECSTEGLVEPVYEYRHDEGVSISAENGILFVRHSPAVQARVRAFLAAARGLAESAAGRAVGQGR